MKKFHIILAILYCSCTNYDSTNDNLLIESYLINDTIYEYQDIEIAFNYSKWIRLNKSDSILVAGFNFGESDPDPILFDLSKDTTIFTVGLSPNNDSYKNLDTVLTSSYLPIKFFLKTKNGIDTIFSDSLKFYYNELPDSPIADGIIKNGKRVGKWIIYQTTNKENIRAISYYNKEGLRHGTDTVYYNYSTGKIYEIIEWKNGMMDGLFQSFNPNGKLGWIGRYKNGVMDSTWVNISSAGFIHSIEEYHNGELLTSEYKYDQQIKYSEMKTAR